MYKDKFKHNVSTGKALLFIGVYMIQLFCYQVLIVSTSDTNNGIVRKHFSPSKQDSNSAISVFRTLEKHCEFGKEASIKKTTNERVSLYNASALLLTGNPTVTYSSLPLLHSDVSYKRYLSLNVFRI